MDKSPLENHYDTLYSDSKPTFGGEKGEPEEFVQKIISYIKEGAVLELGSGQGRNALWLGRKGFNVEAQDISSVGIENINRVAKEENLTVIGQKADSRESPKKLYDVVISTYMFHHLTKDESLKIFNEIKNHTNSHGLNVITTFTKVGDFFNNKPNTDRYYPEPGEIKEIYKDWNVLEYEEVKTKTRQTNEDGSPMFNVSAKIIAKKP